MLYDFSGRSANYAIEPGTFRSRTKVCGEKGQDARLESRRCQTLLDSIPKDSCPAYEIWRSWSQCSYSFARVSAVLKLKVDDYYHNGARRRLRLHEKGGKDDDMPGITCLSGY